MNRGRTFISALLAISLSGCGGGGTSNGGGAVSGGGGGGGVGSTACSLASRQQWAFDVLNEWYLFPDKLDTSVNKASYSTVQSYIDALVAPSVAPAGGPLQHAGLTYITSIAEENALINSGSSAGFGIRLAYDTVNNRVFILEAFENAPGLAAGMDRGTEILSIGTSSTNLQTVTSLMASGGPQAVVDALGPTTAGTTRVLQFRTAGGVTMEASVSKADYSLDPVSDRYGAKIIDDGGKKVGYLNLRTFIVSSGSNELRNAFQQFKAQGVTELIVDLRYNGGGLVSVAEVFGDLMGADKVGQVFSNTVVRDSKTAEYAKDNEPSRLFETETDAISPTKVAFIGRGGTASASELIANSMLPYLGNNTALVGTNTFGKPVGQFGFDQVACDDRLRAIAFKTTNRDNQGEYYTGLASVFPNTCSANDDIFTPLGDPAEASIATALDFLAGRSCTAISGGTTRTTQAAGAKRELLQPTRPSAAQYQIPGLF